MCDEVVLLSSDESEIDDNAPISSILADYNDRHDRNYGSQGEEMTLPTAERKRAFKRDFLSSDSDDNLPDLPSGYGGYSVFGADRMPRSETTTDSQDEGTTTSLESKELCSSQCSTLSDTGTTVSDAGTTVSDAGSSVGQRGVIKKARLKRTAAEVYEQKQQTEVVKEQNRIARLKKKQEKEDKKSEEAREKRLRNEVKKQTRATDCKKYVTALIDTGVVNNGYGAACIEAFRESDSSCVTQELNVKDSIQWKRRVTELSQTDDDSPMDVVHSEVLEKDVMLVLPAATFTQMAQAYTQKRQCEPRDGLTLAEYIQSVQTSLPDACITLVVLGMDKYFRQQKTNKQRQHRQDVLHVTGHDAARQPRRNKGDIELSRLDVEESLVEAQLLTDCNVQMLDTPLQLAGLVTSFTKAIAEAPIKKDRMESAFSFHCEPLTGFKVDKNGQGLLKIWKNQIRQFRAVSADMADAIVAAFPSPQLLLQAYLRCTGPQQAERLLENIQVRRGAGLLETNRRIGKELSRRVYQHMTSTDPGFVIK